MARNNKTELVVLSRLFSSAVFREMAKKGRSGLFRRLADEVGLAGLCDAGASVGDAFDRAFAVLRVSGQRNEYIYRSAISHKILMGTHSLRTASMLTEFRAGTCKADLVILNGTATVYEIKSERDSLARLSNQVANYKKVFAKVNVIASEDHVEGVLATVPEDTGVLCLSKRYKISTEREGVNRPDRVCPQTVFESLRSAEAAAVLKALGREIPQVPNTQLHGVLRTIFADLDPSILHNEMVRTLKRTRNLSPLVELVDQLPESLQAAAISIPVKRSEHIKLVEAVETPLSIAMAWS
ncbi:sce7726 family protein [Rhizobium sp. P007]|uniref:sce7726 family protein n=1 Tax=Rhizobium sp. P007 TaxID=285908 RepID=UPI001FD219E3|nr:sce7726 family protein [Rhizobium sp. P007]